MAIGRRKKKDEASKEPNPEAVERQSLKRLAFYNAIISETPAKASRRLNPSDTVLKHLGKDIVKKSQRRNKYLFSFPGHVAPIGRGGRIGDLKDLGTKNPVLYVDFPQGQMKFFGTILYPKNGYLTLQFSRDGKNALCEDCFDNIMHGGLGGKMKTLKKLDLIFQRNCMRGKKLTMSLLVAGAAPVVTQRSAKNKMQHAKKQPEVPTENDMSESENILEDTKEVVPVYHANRYAGKT